MKEMTESQNNIIRAKGIMLFDTMEDLLDAEVMRRNQVDVFELFIKKDQNIDDNEGSNGNESSSEVEESEHIKQLKGLMKIARKYPLVNSLLDMTYFPRLLQNLPHNQKLLFIPR